MVKVYLIYKVVKLEIKIPVNKVDDMTYNYPIPRPISKDSFLSPGNYTVNASKKEFMDDISFQIPKSLNGDIEEIAFESLYQIMVRHINKLEEYYRLTWILILDKTLFFLMQSCMRKVDLCLIKKHKKKGFQNLIIWHSVFYLTI